MANANSPIPTANYTSDKQPNSTTAVATNPTSAVVGDYVVSSKIGQGSFATVFKAVHKVCIPALPGIHSKSPLSTWTSSAHRPFVHNAYPLFTSSLLDNPAPRCYKICPQAKTYQKAIWEFGIRDINFESDKAWSHCRLDWYPGKYICPIVLLHVTCYWTIDLFWL